MKYIERVWYCCIVFEQLLSHFMTQYCIPPFLFERQLMHIGN